MTHPACSSLRGNKLLSFRQSFFTVLARLNWVVYLDFLSVSQMVFDLATIASKTPQWAPFLPFYRWQDPLFFCFFNPSLSLILDSFSSNEVGHHSGHC